MARRCDVDELGASFSDVSVIWFARACECGTYVEVGRHTHRPESGGAAYYTVDEVCARMCVCMRVCVS